MYFNDDGDRKVSYNLPSCSTFENPTTPSATVSLIKFHIAQ